MDLDLAMDQVDDPVDRNPSAGIRGALVGPVIVERRERDLDQEQHVAGLRDSEGIVLSGTSSDRDVRLRLVVAGNSDRLLRAPGSTRADQDAQVIDQLPGCIAMLGGLRHFLYQEAVDQLDPIRVR